MNVWYKRALLPIYVAAVFLPRLFAFPAPLQQVQLTELLFLPLLLVHRAALPVVVGRHRVFFATAALYVVANLVSAFFARDAGAIAEATGRGYLVSVVAVVLAYARQYGTEDLVRALKWSTIAVAVGCVLYYLLVMIGLPDRLNAVARIARYPYLGDVYRLRGTANVYGMMYMLLLPGLVYLYVDFRRGNGSVVWPALVLLAGALTLAKENLLFPMAVLLYEARRSTFRHAGLAGAGGLAIVLILGTHFLVVPEAAGASPFTAAADPYAIGDLVIVESVYTPIKRAGLEVGRQHPWTGVGPGNFVDYSEQTVAASMLPANFGRFDPHSAWTGAFAETGVFGVLTLLLLVGSLIWYRPATWTVPAILLLLFLVASVFKDVMNFRGLWLMGGLYLCRFGGRTPYGDRPTSPFLF